MAPQRAVELLDFEVQNFKSCVATKSSLESGLTVLIGRNGAGKTNFLSAVLLLKRMIEEPRAQYRALRSSPGRADINLLTTFRVNDRNVRLWSQLWTDSRDQEERISFARQRIRFLDDKRIKWTSIDFFMSASSIRINNLSRIYWDDRLTSDRQMQPYALQLRDFLSEIKYISATQFADPTRCPLYIEIDRSNRVRQRDGGHEGYLFDLYQSYSRSRKHFESYMSIVGPDGIGLVDDIGFEELNIPSTSFHVAPGGQVRQQSRHRMWEVPVFTVDGLHLSPTQLSEGTFKTLALIFYLTTAESKLLLVEEPEVCVHHGLLRQTVELIRRESQRRQLVVSTHSDFTLNFVRPDEVRLVEKSSKSTTVKTLPTKLGHSDFALLKDYLVNSGTFGDFVREGGLLSGEI